jgi:hypothetical protein
MGKRTYFEGLWFMADKINGISANVRDAESPHHLSYPITQLLWMVSKLQKYRDVWAIKKAKQPSRRLP